MLRLLARTIALLLLVSIGHALGTFCCDPLVESGTPRVTSETAEGAGDHCGDLCVPDCYACSTTLAAKGPVRIETPVAVAYRRSTTRSVPSAGVASIPDPVPRTTA